MQIDEKAFQTSSFHLAGIIPIAGQRLDFNMDWADCLMPIAPDYTLIDHAVYECAYAGCETIWIVCNDDTQPLIRHRIGDYIEDPVYLNRSFSKFSRKEKSQIPIFYIPIHPKDRNKRDCLSWSVLHGAITSLKVSSQISKWLIPDKYYVSFPYGVFPVEELRPHRKAISSAKNFYIRHDGQTVQDNIYTSFTFGKDEFVKYRRTLRKKATGLCTTDSVDHRGIPRSRLPIEKRYSARFFDLKDVFCDLDLKNATFLNPSNYYNIASWREYRIYMSSDYCDNVVRPDKKIMNYREFNPIGVDEDQE